MSDIAGTYRFLLDGAVTGIIFGNEFGYSFEKAEGSLYFRKKLSNKIQFYGVDYTAVEGAAIQTKFSFTIEKYDGDSWDEDFVGFFYKTDCDFNFDDKIVTVKPLPEDGYEDVKRVLTNEYNLIDLAPTSTTVKYDLRPVLQIITKNYIDTNVSNDKLTNIIGLTVWEETIDPDLDPLSYGFQVDEYRSGVTVTYRMYYRYLTTLNTFNSVAVSLRSANDLSAVSFAYDKISNEVDNSLIQPALDTTAIPSVYGKAVTCLTNPTEYYTRPSIPSTSVALEVNRSEWTCVSFWFGQSVANDAYEQVNSDQVTVSDSYKVSDVISILLAQETNILHAENSVYSEFFYNGADPIASKDIALVITPKSNIANSFGKNPARIANIRLIDVLKALEAYKVGWHIEVVGLEKRLRLEHVSWYEKGGSYGAQEISIDLTESLDNRLTKMQSNYQNKYSYRKSGMPQRYEFKWQTGVQPYFDGSPINILTEEINYGQIVSIDNSLFNPDIVALAARSDENLDGFAMMDTEIDGSSIVVKFADINVSEAYIFDILNGPLSYKYLHPLYHRYSMPTEDIEINGVATTALSIIRNKQQEVVFQYSEDIDPMNLITTELGSGQVDKLNFNIVSNTYKATINLDTE